jgi:hypothetical protein
MNIEALDPLSGPRQSLSDPGSMMIFYLVIKHPGASVLCSTPIVELQLLFPSCRVATWTLFDKIFETE